jgi:hypothetical protein
MLLVSIYDHGFDLWPPGFQHQTDQAGLILQKCSWIEDDELFKAFNMFV